MQDRDPKLYVRCDRGHPQSPENQCKNGQCRPCKLAAGKRYREAKPAPWVEGQRRYRQAHADQETERKHRWAEAHPEKSAEYSKRHRETRPEAVAAARRRWYESHPDAVRLRHLGRGSSAVLAYIAIIERDPCAYCGASMEQIDHIDPVAKGGRNEWENYTPACGPCNRRKNATPLVRFLLREVA